MSEKLTQQEFYLLLQQLPKPQYPWPDHIHPAYQQQREEYYAWIEKDYSFHSKPARDKHKPHNLTDIAARGLPFLKNIEELRPIANFASNGAMLDDYLDRCTRNEVIEIVKQIGTLLSGEDPQEPVSNGFLRQWWVLRQQAIRAGLPNRHYQKFVQSILHCFNGYAEEKVFYSANTTPPLTVYTVIREATSGGLPFCKYVALQKNYSLIPDEILDHPHILRMHVDCAMMIGIHNDFISLAKEMFREGDTMNIVKVMLQQHNTTFEEAYRLALEHHDAYLKEFLQLQQFLPRFGDQWDAIVSEYTEDLGIMVAGVYAWHTNDKTRYIPGGYVEGEFNSHT